MKLIGDIASPPIGTQEPKDLVAQNRRVVDLKGEFDAVRCLSTRAQAHPLLPSFLRPGGMSSSTGSRRIVVFQ